jgi:pimeloyl-[acyl-carrier protein] synthase
MTAALAPEDLDRALASDGFFADPYPAYARFRAETPVHRSATTGAWMLFRYDDVAATLKDHRRFGSAGRFRAVIDRLPADWGDDAALLREHFSVGLIASDPPVHNRMRGLMNRAFTPRVVEALRPRVVEIVDDLLDAAAARGSMDVVADLAFPLPAIVIAELFGAPAADRDRFKAWTGGIMRFQGTGAPSREDVAASRAALADMRGYIAALAAERRHRPTDDLLGRLVAAEAEGDTLSEGELLATCVTLLTAGHETTTNLIASGVHLLLRHPEQMAKLRAHPDLMPSAVEEILRLESPLQRNPRMLREDVELRGQRMRAGDYVLQVLGSANRDPARFPDPDRFDIARTPNRHLAFGHGVHFCLGAPLARLEGPVALRMLLERFPTLRPATDTVTWRRGGFLRGLEALPVAW